MCNLPEGVDLAEPLLVGQGGDVVAEALEGVVDALHPLALAHVGRVPLLDLKRFCLESYEFKVICVEFQHIILGAFCHINSILAPF